MSDLLNGRTIFITGSGGVLGSTYVRRMWPRGRGSWPRTCGRAGRGVAGAHAGNPQFRFYELDVGDEAQVEAIFARIMGDGWQPNVVLNNAAITGELLMGAGSPSRISRTPRSAIGSAPCAPT